MCLLCEQKRCVCVCVRERERERELRCTYNLIGGTREQDGKVGPIVMQILHGPLEWQHQASKRTTSTYTHGER